MILVDRKIRALALKGMIDPYESGQVRDVDGRKVISFGQSSMGYDMRLSRFFKIFTNVHSVVVDPKAFDERSFVEKECDVCVIPPNSFALGVSVERFKIPRNITGVVLGKSTYARSGIIVCCTPAEAGWEGHLTIEISNTTPLPARVYANEGICQMLFFESDTHPDVSYDQRFGKYNMQEAVPTLPRL